MFDFGFIFGFVGLLVGIFAIVKSAKADQKTVDNAEKILAITDNELEHVKERFGELSNTIEKIESEIDHNKSSISKIYTELGRLDERCKSNHK